MTPQLITTGNYPCYLEFLGTAAAGDYSESSALKNTLSEIIMDNNLLLPHDIHDEKQNFLVMKIQIQPMFINQ